PRLRAPASHAEQLLACSTREFSAANRRDATLLCAIPHGPRSLPKRDRVYDSILVSRLPRPSQRSGLHPGTALRFEIPDVRALPGRSAEYHLTTFRHNYLLGHLLALSRCEDHA